MIKYDLICDNKHIFDGWFKSSEAFETQKQKGLLCCPICNSIQVDRALMTPNVQGTKKSKDMDIAPPTQTTASTPNMPQNTDSNKTQTISAAQVQEANKVIQHKLEFLREFKKQVKENTEDVGNSFAEEARKIHYKEAEPRNIRGETTAKEAKELNDEGINFLPIPDLPEDLN